MKGRQPKKARGKPVQDSLTCRSATSLIAEYLSAELDPGRETVFEEHLRACPDCLAFLKTYKKTIELTRSFLAAEPAELTLQGIRSVLRGKTPARKGTY